MSRRPGVWGLVVLLVIGLFVPGASLRAQEPDTDEAGELPWSAVTIATRMGSVGDQTRVMPGGWLSVAISSEFAIGGGGFLLPSSVEVEPVAATRLDLDFGYAGLFLVRHVHLTPRIGLALRGLAGAGHASVRPRGSVTEVGADNFAVVEGEIAVEWMAFPGIEISLGGGYRGAIGVQDLRGLEAEHFSTPLASLAFSVTGR